MRTRLLAYSIWILPILTVSLISPPPMIAATDPPLITAAKNGKFDDLNALLTGGADVAAKDQYGYTALMWALSRGNAVMVRALLDKGAVLPADSPAFTPLIAAAKNGAIDVIQLLLAREANPNAKDQLGNTALIWAASIGRSDAVQVLLAGKADPNIQNNGGQTALILAAQHGFAALANVLLDGYSKSEPAKPDLQDRFGYTALIWAARNNKPDAIKVLLAHKADPTIQSKDGSTAAGVAAKRGSAEALALLTAH